VGKNLHRTSSNNRKLEKVLGKGLFQDGTLSSKDPSRLRNDLFDVRSCTSKMGPRRMGWLVKGKMTGGHWLKEKPILMEKGLANSMEKVKSTRQSQQPTHSQIFQRGKLSKFVELHRQ
jgi:hypothetical protein